MIKLNPILQAITANLAFVGFSFDYTHGEVKNGAVDLIISWGNGQRTTTRITEKMEGKEGKIAYQIGIEFLKLSLL